MVLIGQAVFAHESPVKGGWENQQFAVLEERELWARSFRARSFMGVVLMRM